MLLRPLSLAVRRVQPRLITTCRQFKPYSQLPTLQKAAVTLSFDDLTNNTLEEVEEALSPWLRSSSKEIKVFDIVLDHNAPDIQAKRLQTIAGNLAKFEIGEVSSRLQCPNLFLRVAKRKDWNGYYDDLYEQFRQSRLAPSIQLPLAPDFEFLCNIAESDRLNLSMSLQKHFPHGIHLGSVAKLNIYKDHDGKRRKSSFDIGSTNSVLGLADPFAWGLPIPIPIPIGAMAGAAAGAAAQSPPATAESGEESSGDEDGGGDGGDGGGWIDGVLDGIGEMF